MTAPFSKESPLSSPLKFFSGVAGEFDARYRTDADFRERFDLLSGLIDAHSRPDGTVLDIGCGGGVFSLRAAAGNRSVLGIDGSPRMIEVAEHSRLERGIGNVSFRLGRVEELPLDPPVEPADLLICSSVLEYVEDLPGALGSLRRLLTERGTLILSLPNRRSLYRRLERLAWRTVGRPRYLAHLRQVFTPEELAPLLAGQGLEIVESRYLGRAPHLGPLLRRLLPPRLADTMFAVVCRPTR